MIYITGDTHRDFYRIKEFCRRINTCKDDIIIILGDAGINYELGTSDKQLKNKLKQLPITLFCIHGNHEERPYLIKDDNDYPLYKEKKMFNGVVYVEDDYPNIIFGKDGEYYSIGEHNFFVIGGAYSIDKYYRLAHGYKWFKSEQPSEEIKKDVEIKLAKLQYKVDIVLSHTAPLKYEPVEFFLSNVNESNIDKSTEIWLDQIESKLEYNHWYFGHYHNYKRIDKMELLFQTIKSVE